MLKSPPIANLQNVSRNTVLTYKFYIKVLTEIEQILNPDFLRRLVSIESIQQLVKIDSSTNIDSLTSLVDIEVMVIEPTEKKGVLSENIYNINVTNIGDYTIEFNDTDSRSLNFDTDEVWLEMDEKKAQNYILNFSNDSVIIQISFKNVILKLIRKREFIDGQ